MIRHLALAALILISGIPASAQHVEEAAELHALEATRYRAFRLAKTGDPDSLRVAVALQEEMLDRLTVLGQKRAVQARLIDLATLHARLGEPEVALRHADRVISHFTARQGTHYAHAIFRKAEALRMLDRFREAGALMREALEIFETWNETVMIERVREALRRLEEPTE